MKIVISAAALLLTISITLNFVFFNNMKTQKENLRLLESKVENLEKKLETSKQSNNGDRQKAIGEQFIHSMFTYDNKTFKKTQKQALELTEGKAKEKLLKSRKATQEGSENVETEYSSNAVIKESIYNQVDEKTTLIITKFGHSITISGNTTSTPYEMKAWISNIKGKWKIINYELNQGFL